MTLSLPRWSGAKLPRLRGLLPVTALTIALLIAVPALQLRRYPRTKAAGLERLLAASALIQSFAAAQDRPAPGLWNERLGASQARQLWDRQRGLWWQFWGQHGDGGAYLALPARAFGVGVSAPLPPNALTVDDLVVIAPDPLSRQLLQEQLQRSLRAPQGLNQRCVERLRGSLAVAWTNTSLARIAGPLAPLLQQFQQGCLVLGSDVRGLTWQGEASAVPEPSGSAATPPASLVSAPLPALPAPQLLEVRGARLDLLLRALLDRQIIREPLAERYGLTATLLERLQSTPFLLRLTEQPRGPFQASLALHLVVGSETKPWAGWLAPLRQALAGQGLRELEGQGIKEKGQEPPQDSTQQPLPESTWAREDGTVVGGWRWIPRAAGATTELVFFLGSDPPVAGSLASAASAGLRLRARPAALAALSLLPAQMPVVVLQAEQLDLISVPAGGGAKTSSLWWLRGDLQLPAAGSGSGAGGR